MNQLRVAAPWLRLLCWLWTCGLTLGCFGGARPEKPAGSALWVTRESGEFEAAAQERLAVLGLHEIYLDAAELEWNSTPRLRRLEWPTVPPRTPATLVISGRWLPGDRPPEVLGTALRSELGTLRVAAEQRGLAVRGFHFNVEAGESAESLGRTLDHLRTLLGKDYFVSARLDRKALEGPAAKAIADGVDYVVSMIYGQRPGEAEDATAWDLEAVERSFRRLEALRRPYFTGVITLGTATWSGRRGEAKGSTTELSLGALVGARNLELKPGFSLLGIDRQVWEFVARGPARVGEWSLSAGDVIRVVRTATPFLEEYRRQVGAWEAPHRLGDVFFRLRRPGERLSLSVDNLADVLAPDAASPVLDLAVERLARDDRRWRVRLKLANQSSESTDLAYFDSNFIELHVTGATIGTVDAGQYQRLELLLDGEKGTMRAIRGANTVRFYLPLLEENEQATTGEIELKLTQQTPVLTVSANFLLADGRSLTIEPLDWQFEKP